MFPDFEFLTSLGASYLLVTGDLFYYYFKLFRDNKVLFDEGQSQTIEYYLHITLHLPVLDKLKHFIRQRNRQKQVQCSCSSF